MIWTCPPSHRPKTLNLDFARIRFDDMSSAMPDCGADLNPLCTVRRLSPRISIPTGVGVPSCPGLRAPRGSASGAFASWTVDVVRRCSIRVRRFRRLRAYVPLSCCTLGSPGNPLLKDGSFGENSCLEHTIIDANQLSTAFLAGTTRIRTYYLTKRTYCGHERRPVARKVPAPASPSHCSQSMSGKLW